MKNLKIYFYIAFTVIFCASFHAFAMEPIGESNTSNESGISELQEEAQIEQRNKQQLTSRIKKLQNLNEALSEQLKEVDFSPYDSKKIKELQEHIQTTISIANDMLSGHKFVNIKEVSSRLETAHKESRKFL